MTLGGWVFLALGWGGTLWLSYFAYRKLLTKKAVGKGEGPNMFPTA